MDGPASVGEIAEGLRPLVLEYLVEPCESIRELGVGYLSMLRLVSP